MRRGDALPDIPSLPDAVEQRWRKAWGDEVAEAAARLIALPPPLDIQGDPPSDVEGISLLPGHLRLARGTAITGLTGYGEGSAGGSWWIQDIAASIPARLLGEGGGRHVLDLCAAPGGKTMQLAAAGWKVTALDISQSRLARLSENLARTGFEAEIVAADVMKWRPDGPVDAILLDAPCSATGIFRRHPDVLHRVRPKAIAELAQVQKAMLGRVSDWLKPGGTLVYSVCSLEPEEGEQVAESFLAGRPDWREVERRRLLPGAWEEAGGADSFFIAAFSRNNGG